VGWISAAGCGALSRSEDWGQEENGASGVDQKIAGAWQPGVYAQGDGMKVNVVSRRLPERRTMSQVR
jgi:hypothetical protein